MITGDMTAALGQALSQRIGADRYGLWFQNKTRLSFEQETLRIGVPNHFYQEWLEKTFGVEIKAAATEVLGQEVRLVFALDAELFRAARQKEAPTAAEPPPTADKVAKPLAESLAKPTAAPRSRSRRFRRLDDFIVGPCNRLAQAAAQSLVEDHTEAASPLVLHGPCGVGKTHLLEAIYVGLRQSHPEWHVCFLSAEDFTNRFVQAIHTGKLSGFRKQFRECDALLIDDLQFLAKKPATQEEFQHTLDVLHGEQRLVIATSDCHPRLDDQLTPELIDRLVGGAICGLVMPERATRLDLLRHKTLVPDREPMPADVLDFLADELRGNVRELEGALNSVWHFARAHGRRIDRELRAKRWAMCCAIPYAWFKWRTWKTPSARP